MAKSQVLMICRKCRVICDERVCECGQIPEPFMALTDLPQKTAEDLRAQFLPVNTVDGLKHPPHNID